MKGRGFTRELSIAFSGALVLGYIGMCAFWLVTGMKYSINPCLDVYLYGFLIFLTFLIFRAVLVTIVRKKKEEELNIYIAENGINDDAYKKIQSFLGIKNDSVGSENLKLAAVCSEHGDFEKCRKTLEKTDFENLEAFEQDEYFNILLYGALLDENIMLANDIYRKSKLYFDRSLLKGRNGNVLHTIGLLCYKNGAYNQAESIFFKARLEKDKSLRCECDLCLGKLYLDTGRKEFAKRVCYNTADEICTQKQAERLRQLMIDVEDAYKN